MSGAVHRLAHRGHVAGDSGGGFVVHHSDGLDLMLAVFTKFGFNGVGIHAVTPVSRQVRHVEPQSAGHLLPQKGELSGLEHQHSVARGKRIDQCRFPSAAARGGEDDHRVLGFEDLFD